MEKLIFTKSNKDYFLYDALKKQISITRRKKFKNLSVGIIIDTALRLPPNTGVTYRLYYLSKKLTEKGVNVKIFLCNRNINHDEEIKNLFDKSYLEFHVIPENIFYNLREMKKIIKDNSPNILQAEDPVSLLRYREIGEDLKIPFCLEMHDVEATIKELLGFHPGEINLTKAISNFACVLAEKIICMTPFDYQELINKIGMDKNKLDLIPNAVDLKLFPYQGPNIRAKNIIFVGNMFYWPNQNAVRFIAKKIYPEIIRKIKGVKFTLIGMVPDEIKREFAKNNFVFTGSVDNINNFLREATIALCPVIEGSGMKVKLLNYCAAGLPVITTKIGASGYEAVNSLIIENNLNQYPKIIIYLLSHPDKMKTIGKDNRMAMEKYYSLDKIAIKIIRTYQDILNNFYYKTGGAKKKNVLKLPVPLYLKEKRIKQIRNNNYYIIKNGELDLKKNLVKLPKIIIVEGFWQLGKTRLIIYLAKKFNYGVIGEPNHIIHGIEKNISKWYRKKHLERHKEAIEKLGQGKSIIMERSIISNIAFYYAKNHRLPLTFRKDLQKIKKLRNFLIIFLYADKNFTKEKAKKIRDISVKNEILNNPKFYQNYLHFYKDIIPPLIDNKIIFRKVNKQERFKILQEIL